MGYHDITQEKELPPLAELFEITIGETVNRLTSHSNAIIFQGAAFDSAPISRSAFSFNEQFKAWNVTVQAPMISTMLAYIANSPVEPARVRIWRAFTSDLTAYRLVFNGTVKTVTFEDQTVSATCESLTDILRVKLPKIMYQAHCNHTLFDSGCTLSASAWKVSGVVTVSGSNLISSALTPYADFWFGGGYAAYDSDFRLITANSGDTAVLQVPFDSRVVDGVTVDFYPGCDKRHVTCDTKFLNLENVIYYFC